ncbi:MAG: type IV secretion system DNA-binding domain-containing protein [Cyanobacteria bacterium P01_F01_bin.143]
MTPRHNDFNPDFGDLERQIESLKNLDSYYDFHQKQTERERQERTELYPSASGIPNLIIGGKTAPIDRLPVNIGIQGITRSGKSLLMNIYVRSVFEAKTQGIYRSKNILILDSKGDYLRWTKPQAAKNRIEHRVIKFDDPNSYCMNIAALVGKDPTRIMNFAKTLLPTPKDSNQVFWALMGQGLIVAVIQALVRKYGEFWGLHDIYDTVLLSLNEFYKLVETTPEGKAFVARYFPNEGSENVKYGVLAEFSSTIQNLRPAAELQRRTPKSRWLSAREFIPDDKDSCTVISSTPHTDAALRPMIHFMFQTLTEEIGGLPEDYGKYISLVIDELPFWGRLPSLEKMLQFNPSKGVRAIISWQDYSNVEYYYTPPLARAIEGNLAIKIFLHPASPASAEYAISSLGKRLITLPNISYSANGINISQSHTVNTPYQTGDLYDLPLADPNDGIYFIMRTPNNFNGISSNRLDARTVDLLIPKANKGAGLLAKLFGRANQQNQLLPTGAYNQPIKEQERYLAVRGLADLSTELNNDRAYQEYMSACTTEMDRQLADTVWKSMQQTIDILTQRILQR